MFNMIYFSKITNCDSKMIFYYRLHSLVAGELAAQLGTCTQDSLQTVIMKNCLQLIILLNWTLHQTCLKDISK